MWFVDEPVEGPKHVVSVVMLQSPAISEHDPQNDITLLIKLQCGRFDESQRVSKGTGMVCAIHNHVVTVGSTGTGKSSHAYITNGHTN